MGKKSQERMRVKIIKHLPLGLSVKLENGEHGIIRVREISWEQERRLNWKQLYPVGFEAWAVPLEMKTGDPSELSLRLAEKDPWTNISSHFSKNEVHAGIVTGVMGYGFFVELAPGVTGLLHQSMFPDWVQKSPLDIFWPGDWVRVVVKQVDEKKRRLSLGLPSENALFTDDSQPSGFVDNETLRRAQVDEIINDRVNRKRILVVEDDSRQAELVSNWLRRVGQRVDITNSAEAALSSIDRISPDIVLIDVGLPKMDGITLANQFLEKYPQTRLVVTTDYASAEKRNKELESLQERGVDFLPKPLIPDDMLDFLKKNGKVAESSPIEDSPASEDSLLTLEASPTRSLHMLLQRGRMRLGFETAILFRLDPIQRTVSIVESSLQTQINNYAIPSLIYSPIRDVAEDEDVVIQEKYKKEDEARFQYLLDLFPMQACIGIPVPVNLPQKYALFFLSTRPKEIYDEDQIYAEAVALTAGTYLEQNLFREKYTLLQRSALIGQLTGAVIHEVNNLLGPLSGRLEMFKDKLDNLKKDTTVDEKTASLKTEIEELKKATHKVVPTMRMLGRTITKDKKEILRLDQIIQEIINLMQDTPDAKHVALLFKPPEKLVVVRSQSSALQQILLNLLLNAIQQIVDFRSEHGGKVRVEIEADDISSQNSSIRILVKDNGPGIHTSLWETIFELGYSTRRDGSGIGLYISKSLAEDKLGGRLFVQESYIMGGTTIALEIPHRL
jgi:signal transduction histidine kinase/ActR/RegA family two-component response regulator/predicted RNA-binding protein with RPS1 domain